MVLKCFQKGLAWLGRQWWLGLLLWAAGLLAIRYPQQSLRADDEAYYAQQVRWMLANHDWLTPTWWGVPRWDCPIGLHWLIGLSYQGFGIQEWSTRLPSLVAAITAMVITWRLGEGFLPGRTGLWAAAMLAVMPLWVQSSHLATPDLLLVSLELLTLWGLLQSEGWPRQRLVWGTVAGMGLSLAFLAKGPMMVVPAIALLPYLVHRHSWHRHLTNPGLYAGLIGGAVPSLLWLGSSLTRYGPLPLYQLWEPFRTGLPVPLLPRLTTALWQVPVSTLPWFLLALLGGWVLWQRPEVDRKALWLGYPVGIWLLITIFPGSSRSDSLQLYPPLALLAGVGINHLGHLYGSGVPQRYRLAVWLSWLLGVPGMLAISAGAALLLSPGQLVPGELRPYAWIVLLTGLGAIFPWLIALRRRRSVSPGQRYLWQWGWLLGPWLGIAATLLTGLWGNYSADIKTPLEAAALQPVLSHNPIYMVQPGRDRESILLSFYTPQLAPSLPDWRQLPSEAYAWINTGLTPLTRTDYKTLANLGEWRLIKAPFFPSMTPRG
ncbi:MAG: ArnT family glycosyltransferase [Nodosilinea sp.]